MGKTVQTTQRSLTLNPLGDLNLLSALFGVKVMQPSGKLQLVRWRTGTLVMLLSVGKNGERLLARVCYKHKCRFDSCPDYTFRFITE